MDHIAREYPDLADSCTICTDQDKGIANAVRDVFFSQCPPHMVCLHHRARNLARHGRRCVQVFQALASAPTVAALGEMRNSAMYTTLPPNSRAAISSVRDEDQFLAVAAAKGASTYGKSSSQASESQNSHILKGRSLDVTSSILELARLEHTRYVKWSEAARNHEGMVTPWAQKKLDGLKIVAGGRVQKNDAESTGNTCVFRVLTESGNFIVKIPNFSEDRVHGDDSSASEAGNGDSDGMTPSGTYFECLSPALPLAGPHEHSAVECWYPQKGSIPL